MLVTLTNDERAKLEGPVTGGGGWQTLYHDLQQNLNGNVLGLSQENYDKLVKWNKNEGGWQNRTRAILAAVDRAGGFKP